MKKIDQNNPYEISKFEKEIKKLSYSIKDETLKKYVLESFLEKLNKLTPIQTSSQNYKYYQSRKKKDFKILKETQIIHQKKENLSKIQIIEFSILFLILNYSEMIFKKIKDLNSLNFLSEKNENLKNDIILSISAGDDKIKMDTKINNNYKTLIEEIRENSNIQLITKDKNDQQILELFDELVLDLREQNNLKKIESLEKKLINNLDENSYSELMRLKSQLNRE